MIKFRTGAVALLIASCVILPGAAYAQTSPSLSSLQAQIAALIAQIAQLQAQLNALSSTPTSPSTPGNTSICTQLSVNMSLGASDATTGGQVSKLQNNLAAAGYAVTVNGYYDLATQSAVGLWQSRNGVVTAGDRFTTGYGAVGPSTRAAMARGCETTGTPTTNAVQVLSFEASPKILQPGSPVSLTWNSTGSDNCQLRNQNLGNLLLADAIGPTGTRTLTPTTDTTYVLYCSRTTSAGVAFDSKTTEVHMSTTQLSATVDSSIYSVSHSPGPLMVSGAVSNNPSGHYLAVFLVPASYSGPSDLNTVLGQIPKDGFYENSVLSTGAWSTQFSYVNAGSYRIMVFDASTKALLTSPDRPLVVGGTAATSAPTCSVNVSNANPVVGQQVTVSWTSQNATSANLNPAGGVVATNGSSSFGFGTAGPSRVTIVVYGPGGTGSCSASVNVQAAPVTATLAPSCTLTAAPSSITPGSSSALTWTINNAATGVLDYNGAVTVPASGIINVSPVTTHTYTLAVQGTGGVSSCTATVSVSPIPTAATGLPDLIARVYGPATATVGQTVSMTGYITNNGTGGTGAGFNSVFVTNLNSAKTDWNTKTVLSVPALPGNIVYPVSVNASWNAPGTYEYALCADSSTVWAGTVTESDESNNCSPHGTIVVSSPMASAAGNSNMASALAAIQSAIDALKTQYSIH